MVKESDGIEEAFEGAIRVAVTVASRTGEVLARAREEQLRRVAAANEQHARELAERLRAEQAAARSEVASVFRAEWWDRASADDVQRVYTTARAWAGTEPETERAAGRIRDELRSRYGIDVDNTGGADPDAVRGALARAEADHAAAEREHIRAAGEEAEAQQLMAEADRADQTAETARAAAEHEPDPNVREGAAVQAERDGVRVTAAREASKHDYDSAERRQAFTADLEQRGTDQETIAARTTADVSQGAHPSGAVKSTGTRAPKARRGRRPNQRQPELGR